MTAPLNISERFERMARAAGREREDALKRTIDLGTRGFTASADVWSSIGFQQEVLARILRAGIDPSEPLREENIRG